MKKKMIMSMTVILVVALFAIIQVSMGREMDEQSRKDRALTEEYMERGKVLVASTNRGVADGDAMRKRLEKEDRESAQQDCIESVREKLQYIFDHYGELEKGDNSDIQIVAEMRYSLRYLYTLVLHSDYDQRVHTKKEKKLWGCLVYQYTDVAQNYLGATDSLTQEKADLLKAQSLSRQLSKNLDEEVEVFVDCLVDVIEEGTQ